MSDQGLTKGRRLLRVRARFVAERAQLRAIFLGEQDYWFAHGEHLFDALVRVPLWLRVPGLRPARRDDVATLLDLHATLRGLAEIGAPAPGTAALNGILDNLGR